MSVNLNMTNEPDKSNTASISHKINGGGYNVCLSLLCIMSTLAVVFLHTCSTISNSADMFQQGAATTLLYNRLSAMMCWSVPCFTMITGALLLKSYKKITIKICLSKYTRRILLALFLFGVPFALMKILFETKTLAIHSLWDAVLAVLQKQSWDHLWYLYALIGAYLLLPILKKFTDHCTKYELLYACGLLLFFDCLIPVLNAAFGIEIALTIWLPLKPCYYILAGHYLSHYTPINNRTMTVVVSIFTFTVMWILKGFETNELVSAVTECLTVVVSTAVFILFTTFRISIGEKAKSVLWNIDRLCFGVYLVPPVFIHLMYRLFHVSPVNFGNSFFAIMMFFIGFTTASFAASYVMHRIKPLREYVL